MKRKIFPYSRIMQNRTGLMSRRKAATAGEIATEAARLFSERGVAQVTAAEIAEASGVSLRTFYRYFPTKEDAVAPVLEIGAARWQAALEEAEEEPAAAIPAVLAAQLTPETPEDAEGLARMRPLLRALAEDRELRAVWHRVNHESEERLVALISERGERRRGSGSAHPCRRPRPLLQPDPDRLRRRRGEHARGEPVALAAFGDECDEALLGLVVHPVPHGPQLPVLGERAQ